MENLKLFESKEFGKVRTLTIDGKPYFVASDVAKCLGYKKPDNAIKQHCRYTLKQGIPHPQSKTKTLEANVIPEGDIYRLITNSELPDAEKFESWVFDEVLPTIRKTGGYVGNDEMFVNTYLPFADDSTILLFKTTLQTVRSQNEIIQKQKEELEYKDNVIIGLVDEITLAEKRQILNRVVRHNGANYKDRWNLLYREFDNKYHINSKTKMENYNEKHKPKCKSRLDYIDKVMNKIPELYEVATKLFHNDVEDLVQEMYRLTA